ncbi:MAG: sigma-70 family RNA polymerase sigma factor [Planctomycetes bacterium]|nr:sigma-70 family RNA polymerase sigma factor [Planctomycetota bacterium]
MSPGLEELPDDEQTLVDLQRARAADQDAWQRLYSAHESFMRRVLRNRIPRKLRSHFDTEDLMQSAFLTLTQRSAELEVGDARSFRGWLARVLVNKLVDRIRAAARRERQGFVETRPPTSVVEAQTDDGPSLEELAEQAEILARMVERILALPLDDRELVLGRFVDGLTWVELARRTGLAPATVSRRYQELLEGVVRGFF